MQNKLNQFIGERFIFSTLEYKVLEVKIVNQKAAIKTDRRTFVFLESELTDFMESIKFLDVENFDKKAVEPKKELQVETIWSQEQNVPEVAKTSVLQAEIVMAESTAHKVSNKLMEVFEMLANSPTEETYKKAAAMVNVSNSIVNVQMAQIKFLSLKK
jgi:hypothetical protein